MSLSRDDDDVLLLLDPRCSKCRGTRALLEERGITFRERRYLDDPLDEAELRELAKRLARPPVEWIRAKEAAYAEAGLDGGSSDEELLAAVARHPILLERPIVVRGSRARVGRPPESVLEILEPLGPES